MAERSSIEPEQAHLLNLDDDLRDAQEMLVEISHKWYDIGLQLKVKPSVLRRIKSQYSDPAECLREMLSDWLIGINPYPTWEALAQALESRTVKEDRLAKKVRETLIVSGTTTHLAPAPSTAHPIQQMASTHAQVAADPAYQPSIHTYMYTQQGYNPAFLPIAPTPSQQSAHLHQHNLSYFTRPTTATPSDPPPQLPGVPIPPFPTHSYQQTAPSHHHPHMQMALNPTPNPSLSPYSVPPHPQCGYTQSGSTPPQPNPIPTSSDATPLQDPMDPTHHPPSQSSPTLAPTYTPPQPHPIPTIHRGFVNKVWSRFLKWGKTALKAPNPTYHPPTQSQLTQSASTPPQPHPIPSDATPIQDPMDPMHHRPTQRPPPQAMLPPHTPAPQLYPVNQYAKYLRAYYRRKKLPTDSKWPPTAAKKYIHLAVVKKQKVSKQKADEFTKATLHGNIEDIIREKESLDFSGIGKKKDGSPAQMILVEGGPGIGKTTFAWKVCRKWSKGKILQKYRLVVLLRLRDKRVREARSICDLFYYPDQDVRRDVAQEVTRSNGESVLLLYEGYDELPGKLQTQESIFLEILHQECLPDATILITSRPSATQFLHDKFKKSIDQHIEILGFTKADIQSYVQSVIEDQQLHTEFTQYLKCYPHVRGLMYIPLNAVIVTEIYKTAKLNDSEEFVPTTLTELYTSLSRGMLLRYLKSHNEYGKQGWKLNSFSDLPEELHKQFHTICGIAFRGILKNEFIFDDLARDFNTLDLMQSAPELYVDKGDVVSHNFFHLTLQEFLAAVHVSQQPTEEQLQYFLQSMPLGKGERQQQQERELLREQMQQREQEQRERKQKRKQKREREQKQQREPYFLNQEMDPTIEHSTSTSEPLTSSTLSEAPTILAQQGRALPALQHRKRKVADMQTTGPYPQQRLQSSKQPWIQRHQLQGLTGEPESTTEHSTSSSQLPMTLASCAPESDLIEISTLSLPRPQVVPEQQAERNPLPLQEIPQLPQTPPPLTTQAQGRLEPLQVMTPHPTTESTPLPESPGMQHTADNGRLQLETPRLVQQQLLPQRATPPITNPRPVILHTPPLSPPAGSLPYAVLTSSHYQNVMKFTAGLTKLQSLPMDSILLQGEGDYQEIPLYSLHWLFEAQCISKYSEMIGETTTLSFNHSLTSMTPFDCFVLGFALSHINSTWNISIVGSHIGDEDLEMMVAGMNYKEATLPTSFKSISLNLANCIISSVGLSHLKEMPEQVATRITELNLNGNGDISEGVASLLSNLTSLKSLYLVGTSISPQEVEQLAELLSHSQPHNDNMVREITSALCDNSTLQTLDLEGNAIGPRGATALAEMLRRNTTLLELDVSGNSIGEEGSLKLATSLQHNETLKKLLIDREYKHSLPRELYLKTMNRITFR